MCSSDLKPPAFWAAVDMFETDYETREYPMLEADDVMGVLSTPAAWNNAYQPIIVSSDKDMRTLPSWIFDPYHGTKRKIVQVAADRWWMTQTITGDAVDGYKGLPGAGPKFAEKLLSELNSVTQMWRSVCDAYRAGTSKCPDGLSETDALTMARLARILRPEDYDIDTGVIQLWHPTRPVPLNTRKINEPN